MEVTEDTLKAIGVEDVPTIYVYNKSDKADLRYPMVSGDNIWISAKQDEGLDELIHMIREEIFSNYVRCDMLIPYDRGDIVSYFNMQASIFETSYEEDGTLLSVELQESDYQKYKQFVVEK